MNKLKLIWEIVFPLISLLYITIIGWEYLVNDIQPTNFRVMLAIILTIQNYKK
jgi:hypothetical protein